MIKGDYVVHNTFPNVEGKVSIVEPMYDGSNNIAVLCNDTIGGRLFWDKDDTWDIVSSVDSFRDTSDVIDVEFKELGE